MANQMHAFTGISDTVNYPAIPVRNETNAMNIYSSTFKRIYIDAAVWNPDIQCSFNPRFTIDILKILSFNQ